MDSITAAIIAGVTAGCLDTAKDAVKDAYQVLKSELSDWFSGKSEATEALAQLEQSPGDASAAAVLDAAVLSLPAPESLQQSLAMLAQAIRDHGTAAQQQSIGLVIEQLRTRKAFFKHIQPPSTPGIGTRIVSMEADTFTLDMGGESSKKV